MGWAKGSSSKCGIQRSRRLCLLFPLVIATATPVLLASPAAADNLVGIMKVHGHRGDSATVTTTGLDQYDGIETQTQSVSREIAKADSSGQFDIWVGSGSGARSRLALGTYDVNWINLGYSNHTTIRNPTGYCQTSTVPSRAWKLGTVTVNSDGNMTGGSGTYHVSSHTYGEHWVTFRLPDSAQRNAGTEESGICVSRSDGRNGNQAPLRIVDGEKAGCPQGAPTVSDDGPTGPDAEGGCASDDVDGENVNNVQGGVPVSSPATTAELVEAFGGSAYDIPAEAPATSTGSALASSPSGFQSGGCPAGGTCTNLQLKWIKTLNIDKRDKTGVRLYFGYETRSWLVPAQVAGGDGKGKGADGRTYDFLSPHVEITPVVGNAVLCSLKNTLARTGGGSPAILSSYPSAAKTPVSPDIPNTITLSANVGGVGLSYSHQFSTATGHIKGVYDPGKSSFTGTWVFGGKCSGRTTPDGVSLDSGISYVYEAGDPAAAARGYSWARKVRKIDTNGAAVACFSPICWPF